MVHKNTKPHTYKMDWKSFCLRSIWDICDCVWGEIKHCHCGFHHWSKWKSFAISRTSFFLSIWIELSACVLWDAFLFLVVVQSVYLSYWTLSLSLSLEQDSRTNPHPVLCPAVSCSVSLRSRRCSSFCSSTWAETETCVLLYTELLTRDWIITGVQVFLIKWPVNVYSV